MDVGDKEGRLVPIRFQVDPDFYDHPKSIGMSDSATALWVRAGSYSAAKLTDGFIAEHVVRTLSTAPAEAASELVERGLWRRTKGGFRFHQWAQRNLKKEDVENFREQNRNRQKKHREKTNAQVDTHIVTRDTHRDSRRDMSVSHTPVVSVSVSPSTSVRTNPQVVGRAPPQNDRREEINYNDLASRLHPLIGIIDAAYARRIAETALAGANGSIANPANYVLAAVAREPNRYRPTRTPPHVRDLCRHGLVGCQEPECM